MDLANKMLTAILVSILAFYLLIYAFVPQITGFASAVSSIDGQDWGWAVYLTFLVLIFLIVYGVASYLKTGKK